MPLDDGQSELDTVSLRLVGTGTEIKLWDRYSVTSRYLTPCEAFEFSLGGDDLALASELLVPGAAVAITVNGLPVLTGRIDKKGVASSRSGGTVLRLTGRDILGPVVSSNVDPSFKFSDSLTVLDVVAAVLAPFKIDTIYNDGALNVNAMTGGAQASSAASTKESVQIPRLTLNNDGSIATNFSTVQVTQVGSSTSLKTLTLQQLKPHFGEGSHAYLQRVVSRFGMQLSAAADGSGVIVDEPDFTSPTRYKIVHSKSEETSNVISANVEIDADSQPACIFAQGVQAPLFSDPKNVLQVIMVNELVGTDADGNPLQEVQAIISRYKGAKVLELRKELLPTRKAFNADLIAHPMFLKDDESKTLDQLEGFVRRTMAEHQHKALVARYTMIGHSQGGVPWTVNTMVDVNDEVAGVTEKLWIMERTFEKSRSGGTLTHLTCVRPFTIELGKARRQGGKKKNTF